LSLAGGSSGAQEQRRTVTVVFCDLTGSTALGETLDPERLRTLLARYFEAMKAIVERHGGSVEKFIGDAVMAVFGVPVVHEDDALRAVRAAAEMRDALPELGLQGRIGVMTGEVVTGTEERLVTGDAVNVAARLEQAAEPGTVLIGQTTLRLVVGAVEVESVEPLALKGKSDPVAAFRLLAVHDAPERVHDTPFVGRDRELALVQDAWERVRAEQRCELVTIVGDAGVGKSRLVAEALASVEATVVRGRCLPYGEGITYWPVVEILKQLDILPPDEAAAAAIRSLLGESEASTSAEEIAWAFRKTLEHVAATRPLVVVFDDIQWGEETFRDLIEHVALLSTGAAILLLCMARPDLTERRPDWPVTLRLEPLNAGDVDKLIGERIPAHLHERITRAAAGNPLFIGEMLAMAGETEGEVIVPPTLQALLAARLDQLEPAERSVLERGAIEGEVFHRGAIQALAPEETHVTPRLAALVRKEIIRPDKPLITGDDGFRFRHLLLRDAAYESLPKATRADFHQRYAGWLEQHGVELLELDEIVGYHREQAYLYGVELGAPDSALGARASERLAAAARAASNRGDVLAQINLWDRAADLVPEGAARPLLLVRFGSALEEGGELARARAAFEEAVALARESGDGQAEWLGRIALAGIRGSQEPEGASENMLREAEAAVAAGEAAGNHEVLARAWELVAAAHNYGGRMGEYARALDQALPHARRAGDLPLVARLVLYKAPYFIWGPGHVEEGLRFAGEAFEQLGHVPGAQSFALHVRAHMRARRGEFEGAFEDMSDFRSGERERGREREYAITADCVWDVCLWAGDWKRGEDALREGYGMLERMGIKAGVSKVSLDLGDCVFRQGMIDEAERLSEIGEEVTAEEDMFGTAQWLTLRARVRAARGDLDGAEAFARRALTVPGNEFPELAAEARLALAETLRLAADPEASSWAAEALELYERKGNLVGAARVREFLANL